jgi:hypothetical protein
MIKTRLDAGEEIIIDSIPDVGPFGDKRKLRITIKDGKITVLNLLAPSGEQLEVSRPIYGYEPHLANEVARLRHELECAASEK